METENRRDNPAGILKKKSRWILAGCCAAALLCAALLFLFGGAERIISVVRHEGMVPVERPSVETSIPAFDGMRLEQGDVIRTGPASSATMSVDESKLIRLGADSCATFEELAQNRVRQATTIYLEQGTLVNDIRQRLSGASTYQVRTPNATVSVRGTYFTVRVGREPGYEGLATVVNVYHGTVEVESADGEITVLGGDGTQQRSLVVPQGDRGVVGQRVMELREGVDFQDLNADDLDRLAELAAQPDGAGVTPEQIEQRRDQLAEEAAAAAPVPPSTAEPEPEDPAAEEEAKPEFLDNPTLAPTDRPARGPDQGQASRPDAPPPAADGEPAPPETTAEPAPAPAPEDPEIPPVSPPSPAVPPAGNSGNDSGNDGGGSGGGGGGGSEGGGGGEAEDPTPPSPSQEEILRYAPQHMEITGDSAEIEALRVKIGALDGAAWLSDAQKQRLAELKGSLADAERRLSDAAAASAVLEQLNGLPYPSQTTSAEQPEVRAVRAACDALTDSQRALLPDVMVEKLEKCEQAAA